MKGERVNGIRRKETGKNTTRFERREQERRDTERGREGGRGRKNPDGHRQKKNGSLPFFLNSRFWEHFFVVQLLGQRKRKPVGRGNGRSKKNQEKR